MNINRLKNPAHKARVGLQIAPYDPFWVLVREAIETRAQKNGFDLVLVETPENPTIWTLKEETQFLEDILALDLDVLISWNLSGELIRKGIAHNLPIVFLSELHDETIDHPKFTSPQGFYTIGESLGHFLAEQLKYQGHFLCLGEAGRRITALNQGHPLARNGCGPSGVETDQADLSASHCIYLALFEELSTAWERLVVDARRLGYACPDLGLILTEAQMLPRTPFGGCRCHGKSCAAAWCPRHGTLQLNQATSSIPTGSPACSC